MGVSIRALSATSVSGGLLTLVSQHSSSVTQVTLPLSTANLQQELTGDEGPLCLKNKIMKQASEAVNLQELGAQHP